ncbi:hypothetical protein O1L55_37505 [Streptomyces albulus]|nr:hypothetical protein [Streptomyces noursei]
MRHRTVDVAAAGPERVQETFEELLALFDRGVLHPLPVTVRDVRRSAAAFDAVHRGEHPARPC